MAKSLQGASLGASATLMAASQRRDGFSEGAAGAPFTSAFEATHLDGENQPLFQDWAFVEVPEVTAMDSVAPAAANWAGCGTHCAACLHGDNAGGLLNVQYVLADAGKKSLEPSE